MPSSYFPLDVNFFDHPKVIGLSDAAVRLELSMIGYANRLMTDGFIPGPIPRSRGFTDGQVAELIRAVLWHSAAEPCPRGHDETCPKLEGDGWRIHDFLEHNRSKDARERQQEGNRSRQAAWRERHRQPPQDTNANVTRYDDALVTHHQNVSMTGNTETETETSKINTVVEQARPIDDITAVFMVWQESTGKHKAKLDGVGDKRRRVIRTALKHYPRPDLEDAVRGWRYSAHHCGQNDTGTVYNELTLLLRDSEHIEYFRDLWRKGPPHQPSKQATQAMRTSVAMRARQQAREVDSDLRGVGRSGGPAERGLPAPTD